MLDTVRLDELLARWRQGRDSGQVISAEELCRDCPVLLPALRRRISDLLVREAAARATGQGARPIDLTVDAQPLRPVINTRFLRPPESDGEMGRLGAYRVLKVLGVGGMGM